MMRLNFFGKFTRPGETFLYLSLIFLLFSSCGQGNEAPESTDTKDSGKIYISVDETFKPIIDSQIKVFEATYPKAHIIPLYKTEADCIRDFAVDSIRMVIITRKYSKDESAFISDTLKLAPAQMVVARDAVAVIVNPKATDTLFTMDDLRLILKGKFSKNLIPIFDGIHATSTVRFIIDSVLHGDTLTAKTMAARSSNGVIDYVAKNVDAVGFVGVSWIGNPEDSTQLSYLTKVKLAPIESKNEPGVYVTPAQYNIAYKRYPMVRDLVYILKEKNYGLAHGFAKFMQDHVGQLIFKRAYLFPMLEDFRVREARLKE
jgi:phosphate transport system substrate-binding protein